MKDEFFEYIERTEHGRGAVFTPYPDGRIDELTWEKGTWDGAGKWWLDKVKCKKCGEILEGHPSNGMGAYAGYENIEVKMDKHKVSESHTLNSRIKI